jgi:hypothetical protein
MKTFKTFQELIDYVPNCIICGKLMEIHLDGRVKQESLVVNIWKTIDPIHFHLKMKDGFIVGNNKKISFTITSSNNVIINGQEHIDNLMVNWITVYKTCRTCRFNIITKWTGDIVKNIKNFPPLTLTNEEIYFTRNKEKIVSINQSYYDDSTLLGIRTSIVINNKSVKPLYIDFNHFKNLDQLNARLSNILVFS